MGKLLLCLSLFISVYSHALFGAERPDDDIPSSTSTILPKPQGVPDVAAPPSTQSEYAFPLEEILPRKVEQGDRFFSEFVKMLGILGLILGLILLMAWVLKKVMNTRIQQINTTSPIKVLESRTLSPKSAIYLLEIQGREIAVAESLNGVTFLGEFPQVAESSEDLARNPVSFSKILEEKTRRGEHRQEL